MSERKRRNGTPPAQPRPTPGHEQDQAAGTIDRPVPPGETQPGEAVEVAQNLGGPIDVFPARGPRTKDRG